MEEKPRIVLPDGSTPGLKETVTRRRKEKEQEDEDYLSVIIKRNDHARRHPDDILQLAIEDGLSQIERPTLSLVLSSMAAGLTLGFTVMGVAVVQMTMLDLEASTWVTRLATAFVYPLGFVMCVMSGTELFTEHTATAFYPFLDRKSSVAALLRLWGVVLAGNLVGAMLSAGMLTAADGVIDARQGYIELGHHLVDFPPGTLVASAVLAGSLMALGAWLILATPPSISQIVSIYIVTFLIGLGGLHHSIAGAVEMFAALLASDAFTLGEAVRFISLAVIGNLIGGSLFVAALNYGHIRKSQAIKS